MHHRSSTIEMIKNVLQDDYIHLNVKRYELSEDVGTSPCSVTVELERGTNGPNEVIEGRGVGFVDALYHGLTEHYAREYPSLRTITFTGFEVEGHMNTSEGQGADAECGVSLVVVNTEERQFRFEDKGRSLVAAATTVVVEAAEYFINSERAYISAFRALLDAKDRGRPDLIEVYTGQLAELVKTTSYSEVIERIKAETTHS